MIQNSVHACDPRQNNLLYSKAWHMLCLPLHENLRLLMSVSDTHGHVNHRCGLLRLCSKVCGTINVTSHGGFTSRKFYRIH